MSFNQFDNHRTSAPSGGTFLITFWSNLFTAIFKCSIKVIHKINSFRRFCFCNQLLVIGLCTFICLGVIVCQTNAHFHKLLLFPNYVQLRHSEHLLNDLSKQRNATLQSESHSEIRFEKLIKSEGQLMQRGNEIRKSMMRKQEPAENEITTEGIEKYETFEKKEVTNKTYKNFIGNCYRKNATDVIANIYKRHFNQPICRIAEKTPIYLENFCEENNAFSRKFSAGKNCEFKETQRNLWKKTSSRHLENKKCCKKSYNMTIKGNYFNHKDNKISRIKRRVLFSSDLNMENKENVEYSVNQEVDKINVMANDRTLRTEVNRADNIIRTEVKPFRKHFEPEDELWSDFHDYCIIGAGPAGLQMAYFLKKAGRDYIIYERNNMSGSFFEVFPRHRKLISINKRFTGKTNREFQLRHDWNSLLSNDKKLSFKYFSNDYFPHADSMVSYLNEFSRKLDLRIQYDAEIRNIRKILKRNDVSIFLMNDAKNNLLACRYTIMATGMWKVNNPSFDGSDMVKGYEDLDISQQEFQGKNVLILGRGNSAFETADSLYEHTNMVHMVSRSRARLAWNTHYVGDLRAINNALLDSYQLKSLDGLLEASVEEMIIQKKGEKLYVKFPYEETKTTFSDEETAAAIPKDKLKSNEKNKEIDNFSLREGYDYVIRCLGFKFDFAPFHNSTRIYPSKSVSKYPAIKRTYESKSVPDLYFAGTITHSLDFRKSSGGFIHGFRYSVQALHHLLEWKNHGIKWPLKSFSWKDILNTVIKRMNEASGPYQMFGVIGDVFIFNEKDRHFDVIEEFPVALLHRLENLTGHRMKGDSNSVLVLLMDYGPDFSGPDKDTLRPDRATGDPLDAHRSNFLHPVLYYYDHLPTETEMLIKFNQLTLPKPSRLHHVLEDFLTSWTTRRSHILPLRRFLETILNMDLRHRFAKNCLKVSLKYFTIPFRCTEASIL